VCGRRHFCNASISRFDKLLSRSIAHECKLNGLAGLRAVVPYPPSRALVDLDRCNSTRPSVRPSGLLISMHLQASHAQYLFNDCPLFLPPPSLSLSLSLSLCLILCSFFQSFVWTAAECGVAGACTNAGRVKFHQRMTFDAPNLLDSTRLTAPVLLDQITRSSSANYCGYKLIVSHIVKFLIIFRVSRRRHEMYRVHGRLCVCPSPHSHTTARTRM